MITVLKPLLAELYQQTKYDFVQALFVVLSQYPEEPMPTAEEKAHAFFKGALAFAQALAARDRLQVKKHYDTLFENYAHVLPPYYFSYPLAKVYLVTRDALFTHATLELVNAFILQNKNWQAFTLLLQAAKIVPHATDEKIQYYGDLALSLAQAIFTLPKKDVTQTAFQEGIQQAQTMLGFLHARHEMGFQFPQRDLGTCYHEPAQSEYQVNRALLQFSFNRERQIYLALSCRDISQALVKLSGLPTEEARDLYYQKRAQKWQETAESLVEKSGEDYEQSTSILFPQRCPAIGIAFPSENKIENKPKKTPVRKHSWVLKPSTGITRKMFQTRRNDSEKDFLLEDSLSSCSDERKRVTKIK